MNLINKTITVKEVFDAIAVDGYDHLRDSWVTFKSFNGEIRPLGACLVGMAAVNLQVMPDENWIQDHAKGALSLALDAAEDDEVYDADLEEYVPNPLYNPEQEIDIIGLSDALNEIIITDVPQYLHRWYTVNAPLGDSLISLNDQLILGTREYRYSYAELTEMARELMTPFFDRIITVTELNYNDASILSV